MKPKPPQLKDGSEWAEHEDCIIGDEAGLNNLINACKAAIEKGEYYGNDLGDYVGVKRIKGNWFNDPVETSQIRYSNIGLAIFLIAIVLLVLVGIGTVLKWLF